MRYAIGPWSFSTEDGTLVRARCERRLEDRAARTLDLLCRRRGEVVSQQDILDEVWQGRIVSANSVAIVIGDIRRALDDDARTPTHVETVLKRGYRLRDDDPTTDLARVISGMPAAGPSSPPTIDMPPASRFKRRYVILAGVGSVPLTLGALVTGRRFVATQLHVNTSIVQNDTGRLIYDRLSRALGDLVDERLAAIPHLLVSKGTAALDGLLFETRLIMWNDLPTLSLKALKRADGTLFWDGMAEGPVPALATNTIGKIREFERASTSLRY